MPQTASWTDLCREPFRLLFPLAVLFGGVGVGYWVLQTAGVSAGPTSLHAFSQIAAYLYCFIAGFLMTALPRFSSTPTASTGELAAVLALLGLHQASLWTGRWVMAQASFLGLLLALTAFAGRRFAGRERKSPVGPPVEFLWILVGLAAGLAGGGLLIASHAGLIRPWWFGVANPLAQQGFVLAVVAGVAGFMAPRLMGRELLPPSPSGVTIERMRAIRLRKLRLHALAALIFLGSFLMEGSGAIGPAYLLRAGVVTALLVWTSQVHRRPATTELYVRLLWLSLWMLLLGLWGAGIWPRYRVAMLHVVFIGGFSLMTFAVGAMVAFSHSGQIGRLRKPLWGLRLAAAGVGVALAARLAGDMRPETSLPWYAAAALSWWCAAASWLWMILPLVTQVPEPGTFERVHDAAKQRLKNPAPSAAHP